MEVAREAGIHLSAICGGRQSCGRCKIRVVSGKASVLGVDEKSHLSEEEVANGFRLACAVQVFDDLVIDIPVTSIVDAQRVQVSGEETKFAPAPVVSAYELQLSEKSTNVPGNEWQYIRRFMSERFGLDNLQVDPTVFQTLRSALRSSRYRVSVLVRDDEVIGVQPASRKPLGFAFDLGTTTIAAYFVDLLTGEILSTRGMLNPQVSYGEDVMSRISYALEGGGDELRESALQALNSLISKELDNTEEAVEVTIVGNTAMHHLILGLPLKQLGTAPYRPSLYEPLNIKTRDLGLQVARGAYAHFLPNIAGFVGSDHVAMLLATDIWETDRRVIGIDIGTNTEITLASNGTLTCLSCASGPAFEGGGISHGMRAANGAIERVEINDEEIHLKVIGNVRPIGICGSGILDLLSELRRRQIIGTRGSLPIHPLVRVGPHGREFILASAEFSGTGKAIVVTQLDIGEILLAKAAIRAGINILLTSAGISSDEIDEVIISGAFGNNINPQRAVDIGLFPSISPDRFRFIGNAAGAGARLALISKKSRSIAAEIAKQIRYIELTTHPQFSRQFSHALRFPAIN